MKKESKPLESTRRSNSATNTRKRCPNCRIVLPAGSAVCPRCHYSFVKREKRSRMPVWLSRAICIAVIVYIIGAVVFGIIDGQKAAERRFSALSSKTDFDNLPDRNRTEMQAPEVMATAVSSETSVLTAADRFSVLFEALPEPGVGEPSMVVRSIDGSEKATTQKAACEYLSAALRLDASMTSGDQIKLFDSIEAWYDEDKGWQVEIVLRFPDNVVEEMLSVADEEIYSAIYDRVISGIKEDMNHLAGAKAAVGVDICAESAADSGYTLRIYAPPGAGVGELGDTEGMPGVYRNAPAASSAEEAGLSYAKGGGMLQLPATPFTIENGSAQVRITDIACSVGAEGERKILLSGEYISGKYGVTISYKLYDDQGYVVSSGIFDVLSGLNPGDKFKDYETYFFFDFEYGVDYRLTLY